MLKLKTAPDAANGILDQYELGPYNLMILGEPSRWRSEFKACFDAGVVQDSRDRMAPCSVLVARHSLGKRRLLHLHRRHVALDAGGRRVGRARPHDRRADHPVLGRRPDEEARPAAEEAVANAKALLKAMKIAVAETRTAVGRTGRGDHRSGLALQDHRGDRRGPLAPAAPVQGLDRHRGGARCRGPACSMCAEGRAQVHCGKPNTSTPKCLLELSD